MEQVNSVIDVLKKLESIELGWCDLDNNIFKDDRAFKKKYVLATPEEVINNKVGTCFDLVELERSYLKNLGLNFSTYFMVYYEAKKVYAHTFLVYEENEKFYWLEHAWNKFKGIHEYMSLYDLLTFVRNEFQEFNGLRNMDLDYLCIYKYKKPKSHIGLKDFYRHCENGENIMI